MQFPRVSLLDEALTTIVWFRMFVIHPFSQRKHYQDDVSVFMSLWFPSLPLISSNLLFRVSMTLYVCIYVCMYLCSKFAILLLLRKSCQISSISISLAFLKHDVQGAKAVRIQKAGFPFENHNQSLRAKRRVSIILFWQNVGVRKDS